MAIQHSGHLKTDMRSAQDACQSNQGDSGKDSPYNQLLELWTRYISLRDCKEPTGDANLQDTKDFMRAGEAMEAMINELPRHQWWAIRKARGISTVWIFPSLNIADALQQAEKKLTPKMQSHIATRRFFN